MPIIPYSCNSCDYKGDALVKLGGEPSECGYCGEKNIVRAWSGYSTYVRTTNGSDRVPTVKRDVYEPIVTLIPGSFENHNERTRFKPEGLSLTVFTKGTIEETLH